MDGCKKLSKLVISFSCNIVVNSTHRWCWWACWSAWPWPRPRAGASGRTGCGTSLILTMTIFQVCTVYSCHNDNNPGMYCLLLSQLQYSRYALSTSVAKTIFQVCTVYICRNWQWQYSRYVLSTAVAMTIFQVCTVYNCQNDNILGTGWYWKLQYQNNIVPCDSDNHTDNDNTPGTGWQLQQKIIQVQFDSDDRLGTDYVTWKFPWYIHNVSDNGISQGLSDDVSSNISTIQ